MTVSAFSIIKNEAQFIGYGVMSLLPHIGEIVYADGNSTDGTLELLEHIKAKYAGEKLTILRDMDCKDLKGDYVRVFNELMKRCKGDYLWYAHPDMILTDPGILANGLKEMAYFVNMRSFAGEDLDLEITRGRTDKWKTIMKNDFGLHYAGYYGAGEEDMYFSDITGKEHKLQKDMSKYPYRVADSGIKMSHFCECKPRKRREEKMSNVLVTNNLSIRNGRTLDNDVHVFDAVMNHPRVTLQTARNIYGDFEFTKRADPLPDVFEKYKEEFDSVLRG